MYGLKHIIKIGGVGILWLFQVYNECSMLEHLLHTACEAVSTMCWYIIPRGSTVCVCVRVWYTNLKNEVA